eukprot:8230949-Heterocapsa_arctica.AAC.1
MPAAGQAQPGAPGAKAPRAKQQGRISSGQTSPDTLSRSTGGSIEPAEDTRAQSERKAEGKGKIITHRCGLLGTR